MADQYRALVSWGAPSAIPRDLCTNTLYFQNDALPPVPDYDQLATDIANAYGGTGLFSGQQINVRMYNMEDGDPKPIRGQYTRAPTGSLLPFGPREVALCLSYYGDRNLPSTRGRVYIGPFPAAAMAERPDTTTINTVSALGGLLAEIGGENISWRIRSVKTGEYHHIRHTWVNNEWDTMRSRGLRQTTRKTADV